jgi:5-methylcytosine-specific restriction endonuclease McrA
MRRRRTNPAYLEKERLAMAARRAADPARARAVRHADYVANREKVLRQTAAYRVANLNKMKTAILAWQISNPDRSRRIREKYKAAHPGRMTESVRRWRLRRPDQARDAYLKSRHVRRARKSAVQSTLTRKEWNDIRAYFGGQCAYCLAETKLTLDHVDPIAIGGHHVQDNVVPACLRCNSSKGPRTLLIWLLRKAS